MPLPGFKREFVEKFGLSRRGRAFYFGFRAHGAALVRKFSGAKKLDGPSGSGVFSASALIVASHAALKIHGHAAIQAFVRAAREIAIPYARHAVFHMRVLRSVSEKSA